MTVLNLLWLVPALPFVGALINGVVGRRISKSFVNGVALSTTLASFAIAVACVVVLRSAAPSAGFPAGVPHFEQSLWEWMPLGEAAVSGGFRSVAWIPVSLLLDPLSSVMLLVVTGVGLLIHVYSTGESRYGRSAKAAAPSDRFRLPLNERQQTLARNSVRLPTPQHRRPFEYQSQRLLSYHLWIRLQCLATI